MRARSSSAAAAFERDRALAHAVRADRVRGRGVEAELARQLRRVLLERVERDHDPTRRHPRVAGARVREHEVAVLERRRRQRSRARPARSVASHSRASAARSPFGLELEVALARLRAAPRRSDASRASSRAGASTTRFTGLTVRRHSLYEPFHALVARGRELEVLGRQGEAVVGELAAAQVAERAALAVARELLVERALGIHAAGPRGSGARPRRRRRRRSAISRRSASASARSPAS